MGEFLKDTRPKMAEIGFPSENIQIYQEQITPGNSGDLLEYAEPWGGAQNRPYVNLAKPEGLERDESITRQGERPEVFPNVTSPESFPVNTTNTFGQGWDKSPDPAAGEGNEPSGDVVYTKPRGDGSNPNQTAISPFNIGEAYEHTGEGEEQTFSDRVYVYASEANGDNRMQSVDKKMVHKVVTAALNKGLTVNDQYKVKVASLADLYSFERLGSDKLVHKSSNELWEISVDKDGSTVIEKQFDDNGKPILG